MINNVLVIQNTTTNQTNNNTPNYRPVYGTEYHTQDLAFLILFCIGFFGLFVCSISILLFKKRLYDNGWYPSITSSMYMLAATHSGCMSTHYHNYLSAPDIHEPNYFFIVKILALSFRYHYIYEDPSDAWSSVYPIL